MSTIKFEKGKSYKMRNGQKVECVYTNPDWEEPLLFVFIGKGDMNYSTARPDGAYYGDCEESEYDIISEWPEERVVWVVYSGFSSGVAAFQSYSMASHSFASMPKHPTNSLTRVVIQDGHFDKE